MVACLRFSPTQAFLDRAHIRAWVCLRRGSRWERAFKSGWGGLVEDCADCCDYFFGGWVDEWFECGRVGDVDLFGGDDLDGCL